MLDRADGEWEGGVEGRVGADIGQGRANGASHSRQPVEKGALVPCFVD